MKRLSDSEYNAPVIRSALLAQFPNVIFGMSTRQGEHSSAPFGFNLGFNVGDDPHHVRKNIDRFVIYLGLSSASLTEMEQVHGKDFREVDAPGRYEHCDALITTEPRVALAVRTADCVPLMLYAPGHNLIAAVHAGWRGTVAGIAATVVDYLIAERGVEPDALFAYLGPSAGPDRYEVSEETAAQFPEDAVVKRENAKPLLNLRKANARQLTERGVPEENIEIDPLCTIANAALFHSHRRDGSRSGRMLAIIAMKERL